MSTSSLKDRLQLAMAGPPRLSQSDLARACGIRPASVNNWVSGKTKTIEGENLLNAARALNVSPDWLATGHGPRERLTISEGNVKGLGESITLDTARAQSQPVKLDSRILAEAEMWIRAEEGVEVRPDGSSGPKMPYALLPRAERLAAIYALIADNGGILSPEDSRGLLEAANRRLGQQRGVGSDRDQARVGIRARGASR